MSQLGLEINILKSFGPDPIMRFAFYREWGSHYLDYAIGINEPFPGAKLNKTQIEELIEFLNRSLEEGMEEEE